YCGRTSATIRTARRRSSSGYWEGRAMTRSSQTIESLPNPERFTLPVMATLEPVLTEVWLA
ncbi:hypothetical protein, partial [Streptomyces aureus]